MIATRDPAALRTEFDAIARLSPSSDAPDALTRALLRHLPDRCGEVLEVGCGTGEATRILAARASRVVALDLSPGMVEAARARSAGISNIDCLVADASEWAYPEARFDAVVSVATLHHLPFEPSLAAFARTLRPGGVLLILDLVDRSHPGYLPLNVVAGLAAGLDRVRSAGRHSAELRRAYLEHGSHERYLRPREARERFPSLLPGARVTHHLRWRYSVVWQKPAEAGEKA
jgi:SAM-dependent methyltransferase